MKSLQQGKFIVPAIVLFGAAYLLFANTFGNQWTYDDFPIIVDNPDIRSLSAFFADSFAGRPLRELTYLLDYQIFGLKPFGWHFQQVFWHGLNGFLLFSLLERLQPRRWVSWLAALLFLAHPLQVEVVASLAHRKDSLSLVFSQLTLLAYLQALQVKSRRWLWLGAAILSFLIGLAAKQNAVMAPGLILAYEVLLLPHDKRLLFGWLSGWRWLIVAAVGVAALASFFLWSGGSHGFLEAIKGHLAKAQYYKEATLTAYYLGTLKAIAFLALRLFWPVDLAIEYIFPRPSGFSDPWVLAALILIVAGAVLCLRYASRQPLVVFAVIWMALFWLPVSNLIWPAAYPAADRYLYAVMPGFCLLVAMTLEWLFGARRAGLALAGGALLVVFSILTVQQNRVWYSTITLNEHALTVSPSATQALLSLGIGYMNEGNLEKAEELIQQAAMNFNETLSIYYLGLVKERRGKIDEAMRYYKRFLDMNDPRWQKNLDSLRIHLYQKYRIRA